MDREPQWPSPPIMVKGPLKLDRLSNSLRNSVVGIGGDPDFIDFLLGWYSLLPCQSTELPTWPYWSTSVQRKKKRELEVEYGESWRVEWKKLQTAAKSYKFYTNLFGIEPQTKKVGHRRRKSYFWFAMSDTQNYFRRISGRPNWDITAKIFYGTGGKFFGYQHAQAEYAKRKGYLRRYDGEIRLDNVIRFYRNFKPVIMEVLESGTPMLAPPHREKVEKRVKKLGIEEALGVVPIDNSAHEVRQPSGPPKPSRKKQPRKNRKISRD